MSTSVEPATPPEVSARAPGAAAPSAPSAAAARPSPDARSSVRLDLVLAAGLALLALAVRWPRLWTVPRFTDETLEVLHSLAIVRDGTRPLTNYDSYYGALYNYVVALALLVSGESPLAPRVVLLLAGALTVVATYFLGVRIAGRLGMRGVASRLTGLLAGGLLAVNGPHVVVNSHIAWSNCLTPLLTTLVFWALAGGAFWALVGGAMNRAPTRAGAVGARFIAPSAGVGLTMAGLVLGLALQTHPLVVVLLPGIALGLLIREWRIVRTPWPWLAAGAFLVGYANVLVYNAEHGFESLRSAQRIQAEYAQDQQAASGYLPTAGSMLVLLVRILGGAADQRESVAAYLADPGALSVCALAAAGLGLLAWRRELVPLLACLSFLAILPAANPKFQTLLTTRYLMPIVPMLLCCASLTLVWLAELARTRWLTARSLRLRRAPLAAALGVVLLLAGPPLAALDRYYQRTLDRTDTNERILSLTAQIEAARRPDEPVLVDDSIGAELPDTGVTELRGLEYLLTFGRVPYRLIRPSPGRLQDSLDGQSTALAILNARDASAAASRVRVESLDSRPPVETGRMFDFRLYRLSRDRA